MRGMVSRWIALGAIMFVTACGGGGGDGTPVGGDGGEVAPPPAADSYWTMDSHTYLNGGHSQQTAATLGDGRPYTIVVVSTATLAGGDQSNGAYSGGGLNFTFLGSAPGTYTVVPDRPALLAAPDGSKAIFIESMVGIGSETGVSTGASTLYTAASGQVEVTKDAAGVYHLSTPDELRTVKTLDVEGGVSGAPATMQLKIHNAH